MFKKTYNLTDIVKGSLNPLKLQNEIVSQLNFPIDRIEGFTSTFDIYFINNLDSNELDQIFTLIQNHDSSEITLTSNLIKYINDYDKVSILTSTSEVLFKEYILSSSLVSSLTVCVDDLDPIIHIYLDDSKITELNIKSHYTLYNESDILGTKITFNSLLGVYFITFNLNNSLINNSIKIYLSRLSSSEEFSILSTFIVYKEEN